MAETTKTLFHNDHGTYEGTWAAYDRVRPESFSAVDDAPPVPSGPEFFDWLPSLRYSGGKYEGQPLFKAQSGPINPEAV